MVVNRAEVPHEQLAESHILLYEGIRDKQIIDNGYKCLTTLTKSTAGKMWITRHHFHIKLYTLLLFRDTSTSEEVERVAVGVTWECQGGR